MRVEHLKKEQNSDEPKKAPADVKLLRKADEEPVKGKSVEDFSREEQIISPATYYRWQRKFGGLQVEDVKRLKALEVENAKQKRLFPEAMLANDAIREYLEKA